MRVSALARATAKYYARLPARNRFLNVATRLEGGQMTSLSLRRVLRSEYGVDVGPYSYGSLLSPGFADSGTKIGRYVSVGPNVRRFGAGHPIKAGSLHPYWYNPSLGYATAADDVVRTECLIDDDCWIGANVTILPSCARIGIGAVIGAGSVVTRDVGNFEVVVGNPARLVRRRFTDEEEAIVLAIAPWSLDPVDAKMAVEEVACLLSRLNVDPDQQGAST